MKRLLSIFLCLIMVLSMAGLTVSAEVTAQEVADSISVDLITTEIASLITKKLTLPSEIDGYAVTWESDSSAITTDGIVTRDATEEQTVTLTATVDDTIKKDIVLTVAPLTTTVVYQNNFSKKLDGTAFDTTKELIGAEDTTQIDNWTMSTAQSVAPFGTTAGETGGVYLDLQAKANSPTFSFPETMDSPFYVQFDVKTQTVNPGIEFRLHYTPEGGKSTLQKIYLWNGGATKYYKNEYPSAYGGTNFASSEENKLTMRMYIDPINLIIKFSDANGNMIPAAGAKLGAEDAKNGTISDLHFCRAGSSSPAGYIEFDNFAVYRTAAETQIYNDRAIFKELAEGITFADFSSEDAASVTQNLDLSAVKSKIESENEDVTVSFSSSNEEALKIDGTTGVVTRLFDDTPVKLEIVISNGGSKFSKTIDLTVVQTYNPAKEAAESILFEMLTNQATHAVTEDLDLSLTEFYASEYGEDAAVTFTSDNEDVLTADGVVKQGNEKTAATLTAKVVKDGREYTKDFPMTILPEGTYVFESDGFGYGDLAGQSIGALDRWVIEDYNERAVYADVVRGDNGYFLETARTKQGSFYDSYYYATGIRKTKKLTFEMDLLLNEMATGTYQDLYFLGVKDGGMAGIHTGTAAPTNYLLWIRLQPTLLSVYGAGSTSRTVAEGENRKLTIDFDFENDCYDLYLDETLLQTGIGWKDSGVDYEGFYAMDICSFRNSANFKIGIDNLSVYSVEPQFLYSEIDDEIDSQRPLTVSTSFNKYNYITVTSDYDENNLLKQNLVEKNETFTNNPIIDFHGAYLVDKQTGKETSLIGYLSADETNPQIINGLYIGSNHGAVGARITSTAHGKTQADVGSVWTDANGVTWDLIRVEDENTLFFLSQQDVNLATDSLTNFKKEIKGPLTYVSDGENEDEITVTEHDPNDDHQTFPSITNIVHNFYLVRDGERIPFDHTTFGVGYKCDELVIEEEYDIINPATIADALRANRPDGGYTEAPSIAVGEEMFHYKQTITVKADGTIFTEIDHTVLTQLNGYETYGYQFYPRADIYGGGVWRQVPGTKEFTDGKDKTFDISTPYEYTIVAGTPGTDLTVPQSRTLKTADWVDSNVVPSRILDFYRDEEGNNVMGYMTGFLPIYDGEPDKRRTKTNSNIYMYDHKVKAYPIFVSSSGASDEASLTAEGSNIKGVSYRKYVDLTGFEENQTQYYAINHENMTYYYIDFQDAGTQVIDLEKSGCIYGLKQVEVIGDITYAQIGETIVVTSNGKGYIVLKAERQLEAESVYIDGSQAGVRLINYSDEAKTVTLSIASYNGSKLADVVMQKNVTIDANATENIPVDVSGLASGSTYKLYVFENGDNIVPVSKDVAVEVK